MGLILDNTLGLERVGREVLTILNASINAELAAQTSIWAPLDATFYGLLGVGYTPCYLEPIVGANMTVGHKPSLLNSPGMHKYPNLSVIPHRVSPTQGDDGQLDHYFGLTDELSIEVLVKSGPYNDNEVTGDGEDLVNRRVQRTCDSVAIVLSRARTLNGLVSPTPEPTTVQLGDVFVSHGDTADQQWFWQGGVLDYSIPRFARAY